MDEFNTSQEQIPEALLPKMDTGEILSGVISSPEETFTELKSSKPGNYWLVPLIIAILLSVISTFLYFQNPVILKDEMDRQLMESKEKLEQSVKDGTLTKEQADQQLDLIEKFGDPESMMTKIISYSASVLGIPFVVIILSLVYMLGVRLLKGDITFQNAMNVTGIASVISAIGTIISAVLSLVLDRVVNISPAILLDRESTSNTLYNVIFAFDVFTIWHYVVIAIGLYCLANISKAKAFGLVFGVWIGWLIITNGVSYIFKNLF